MHRNLLFLACTFYCAYSFAQKYPFVNYTPRDGLVNNRARAIYQDNKGRLYITTFGGLSVFDGSRFTNYTTDNGLSTSLINDVVEINDDSILIVPNSSSLHVLVDGMISDFAFADKVRPVTNKLLKCSDGYYYSISDHGLFRLEKNRFVKIKLIDEKNREASNGFIQAVEKDMKIYILTDPNIKEYPGVASLLIYDLVTKKLLIKADGPAFLFITLSPQKEIVVSTSEGVKKISLEENGSKIILKPFTSGNVISDSTAPHYIFFDRQENLWISTWRGVYEIIKNGPVRKMSIENGLPANNQVCIFQDKENTIWFANQQTGITKLTDRNFNFYSQIQPGFTTWDIFANQNRDSVWFYDGNKEAMLNYKNVWKRFHVKTNASPGSRLIFTTTGTYLIDRFDFYKLNFAPDKNQFSSTLLHHFTGVHGFTYPVLDKYENIITTSTSVWAFLNNGGLLKDSLATLADQVCVDNKNQIWTASRDNTVSVYQIINTAGHSRLELVHRFNNMPLSGCRSITVDNSGKLWIGTRDHGLYCLTLDGFKISSVKQLTLKDGLTENFVSYLHCDAENNIWACSPAGLDKVTNNNGEFFIENITRGNNIFQQVRKVQSDKKGIQWILTSEGVIKILPQKIQPNSFQPGVLFTHITAGNKRLSNYTGDLLLSHKENDLRFHIATPSFLDEKMTRFSFLLVGSENEEWSEPSTLSEINLVNLAPGKYILKVKAIFLNGQYSEKTNSYAFEILAPWWQTWEFRIPALLVLGLLIYFMTKIYVKRKLVMQRTLMEKKQAVEKERTRIATDMHDDLGAGLSQIKFLSETIGLKKQREQPIEEDITKIRKYSHDMIDKMGEIVWALNEKNDSLNDLLGYTRAYAVNYLQQNGISCEMDVPEDLNGIFISGDFRRNIYLTVKEALHNIVKHAQATKVKIIVQIQNDLKIEIHDNGIGFDNNNIRPFSNGISNMKKRISILKGNFWIETENGTVVTLSIPLEK